jgi:hypothetical protein
VRRLEPYDNVTVAEGEVARVLRPVLVDHVFVDACG